MELRRIEERHQRERLGQHDGENIDEGVSIIVIAEGCLYKSQL